MTYPPRRKRDWLKLRWLWMRLFWRPKRDMTINWRWPR